MPIPSEYAILQTTHLRLPHCPLPRPGEKVCWYADARLVSGVFKGHNKDGSPLIINEFGSPVTSQSFDSIRLANPFERRGPNWEYLPSGAMIARPPDRIIQAFNSLLEQRMPPGPRYIDLIHEIWSRGFEAFVVGGTVRDILVGQVSRDVDIVTTMPLIYMKRFLRAMYRYDPSEKENRGFVRIGGTPQSGDPFIDLKVFTDSLHGTDEATFGVGFDRDCIHRDFACNAIYYDPINKSLIDPTGRGIEDAHANLLSFVCGVNEPFQNAQLFVRFFKFLIRGYTATPESITRVQVELAPDLSSMKRTTLAHYLKAQLLNKCTCDDEHSQVLASMQEQMQACGVGEVWNQGIEPVIRMHFNA